MRGAHSKRDLAPAWLVRSLIAFIAFGLLVAAWGLFLA